jgi:hypothetical protein
LTLTLSLTVQNTLGARLLTNGDCSGNPNPSVTVLEDAGRTEVCGCLFAQCDLGTVRVFRHANLHARSAI